MANWLQNLSEDSHAGRMVGGKKILESEVCVCVCARQFVWERESVCVWESESIWYDRQQDPGKRRTGGWMFEK